MSAVGTSVTAVGAGVGVDGVVAGEMVLVLDDHGTKEMRLGEVTVTDDIVLHELPSIELGDDA